MKNDKEHEEVDEQLLFRMKIIQPLVGTTPVHWESLCRQARKAERSTRTIQRWLKAYQEDGAQGLKKLPPEKEGAKEALWRETVRNLYLKPSRPSVQTVHGMCVQTAEKDGTKPPSYSTVHRIISAIPKSAQAYYRNRREFRDKYQVTGKLYQASYPGELYLIDHRKVDVLLVRPDLPDKPLRPWITGIEDQFSRAFVGYYLGFEDPSSRRVAFALRHAILPKLEPEWIMHGIPARLRHDHGSDLVSKHIDQVKIDLKIATLPKEKGNPRANAEKERFFGTMAQWERSLPGWTGATLEERPERISPKLTLEKFDRLFREFILKYHREEHSTTRQTPFDRWNTGLIPRLPESEDALDLLLLRLSRARRIRRDGIHFLKNRYWCDELLPYIGETAYLRYDPFRLDSVVVFEGQNRLGNAYRVSGERDSWEQYRKKRKTQKELLKVEKPERKPDRQKTKGKKQPKHIQVSEKRDSKALKQQSKSNPRLDGLKTEETKKPKPRAEKELKLFVPLGDGKDDWC